MVRLSLRKSCTVVLKVGGWYLKVVMHRVAKCQFFFTKVGSSSNVHEIASQQLLEERAACRQYQLMNLNLLPGNIVAVQSHI